LDTETKMEEFRAAEEKLDMLRISVRVFSHEGKKEFSRSIDTSFGMNDRKEVGRVLGRGGLNIVKD